MTTNQEPEKRSINIGSGNYNESIQGDYIQGNVIQGSVFNYVVEQSLFRISGSLGRHSSDVSKPSTQQEYKQRKILLNQVKNNWIEGVLEKSLHTKVMIELGLEERLDAVEHPGIEELPDQIEQALPTGVGVTDVFTQMGEGRTLLILGEAGAGKTTILLTLAKHLITRTEEDLNRSIPVVFNLSSWATKRQKISAWLVKELNSQYKVSESLAKAWVKDQQLLLLLDGLDEVKSEHRSACIQALNQFMLEHGQTEMVVCSRIQEYEDLSTRLQLQGAICVQSLTDEQIQQYLNSAGNQLEALRRLLQQDTVLQELAKSPLTLSIMTIAYKGKSVQDLPQTSSIEEHRRYLFQEYIEQMFSRKGAKQKYPKAQAMRWLIWLAQGMSQESKTIFLIEQSQPTWLKTNLQKWTYLIIVGLSFGLIFGSSLTGILNGRLYRAFVWSSGLVYCLSFGLTFILISSQTLIYGKRRLFNENSLQTRYQRWLFSLRMGLICGVFFGLVTSLFCGSILSKTINNPITIIITSLIIFFISALCFGFLMGLYFGVCLTFTSLLNKNIQPHEFVKLPNLFSDKIEPIETLKWSWYRVRGGLITGICSGLICFFYFGKSYDLSHALAYILILGAFVGIISGISPGSNIEERAFPNQGIQQSAKNAIIFGLLTGVTILFIQLLLLSIITGFISTEINWIVVIFLTLLGSAVGDGGATIKHFILRVFFYFNGYAPWNYARFLDYATERIFMQKVGGGYIFIHRMLMEHFAKNGVGGSPPQVQNHIVCINCGHHNSANLNFCTKCGSRLTKPHI